MALPRMEQAASGGTSSPGGGVGGMVFDLHPYAVHDGPGIRTVVFLKGCPLSCTWCCNPESQHPGVELMHSAWRCRTCGRCAGVCPSLQRDEEGLVMDRRACGSCGERICVAACPEAALRETGRWMTAEAVLGHVLRDRAFFVNSGGGVTFSGGEPLAQPEFLEGLLQGCRREGVHTAVETCGHADPEVLARMDPWVDLWLYDLKLVDPLAHQAHTGVDNALVLGNLADLARRRPEDVVVRLPLVPGLTDTPENLEAAASLMAELGLRRVDLEPFHLLGLDKYEGLGRVYRGPLEGDAHPAERWAALEAPFRARGLQVEVI